MFCRWIKSFDFILIKNAAEDKYVFKSKEILANDARQGWSKCYA